MKIHEVEQNTLDWMRLHIGIPTASGLDNLLDSEFNLRKGEMPRSYLYKKVAEAHRGRPLVSLNSFSAEQGMILEEEALPFYQFETGQKVRRVGFITTDDGKFGCSPDGLLGDDNGIEIKSPEAWTHTKYLLGEKVPKEYLAQVHGSMFATGFKRWTFMSYRRGFPPLIVEVKRDDEIIDKIARAVAAFHDAFDFARKKISQLDGKVGK